MIVSLLCATSLLAGPLPTLKHRLDGVCGSFKGRIGYAVVMLDTGERISNRGDERFPAASTIKTAIALHAIREVDSKRLKWTDKRELPPAAKRIEYDVSEWSYYMKDDLKLSLDGYVNLMLTVSDNLATRVLREWLGTLQINGSLKALGFKDTKCLSSAPPEATVIRRLNGQFGMGMTTPNEMARLLELVYRRKAASPAGCERLLRTLSHQYWDDWIASTVPPGVTVAGKVGAISRSRSDTAIVYGKRPYILSIYTDNQKDRRWTDDNEGNRTIRKMAGLAWNILQPDRPYTPPAGYEKFLPTGGGVE